MAGDFNCFFDLAVKFNKAIVDVVKKTAFNVRTTAAGNAPVRTGFLRDAIYVKTIDASSYGAGGGSPTKNAYLLPEVKSPPDSFTAYIVGGANYSAYVELGTRYMSPQPFLAPAVDATRPAFESALSDIESQLGGN